MSRRRPARGGPVLVALALLVAPTQGRACLTEGEAAALVAAVIVVPSDIGTLVTSDGPRFVLGWSGQFPFPDHGRHRAFFGASWAPGGPYAVEGRFGYRYAPGRVFGGLGIALDGRGASWAPELGVNLVPRHWEAESFKVHLLVRGQLAPALDQVRGVGLLLGWTIF